MSTRSRSRIIRRIMGAENELSSSLPSIVHDTNSLFVLESMVSRRDCRRLFHTDDDGPHNRPKPKIVIPNQGIIYVDDKHIEYSTPECLGPMELALFESAGLKIMTQMMQRFRRIRHKTFRLYKTNRNCVVPTDTHPRALIDFNTWGSHANYLVPARFDKKPFHDLMLPFLISRWCLIGNGWVAVDESGSIKFLLSQRAEIINKEIGIMYSFFDRRDAAYADKTKWHRYHDVSGNSTLSEWQLFLKYATCDIVLAMLEEGALQSPPEIYPLDFTSASIFFNANPRSKAPVQLLERGLRWNALDFQRFYLEQAQAFFSGPGRGALTPERRMALDFWGKIIDAIAHWELPYLAQFLDWAAILYYFMMPYLESCGYDPESIISGGEEERRVGKTPTAQNTAILRDTLDFFAEYAFMNTADSHYGEYLRAGLMKKLFPDDLLRWAGENPPERTRAAWREKVLSMIFTFHLHRRASIDPGWEKFLFWFRSGDAYNERSIKNSNPYRHALSRDDKAALRKIANTILARAPAKQTQESEYVWRRPDIDIRSFDGFEV